MSRKTLAAVLALVLAACLMPVTAGAAGGKLSPPANVRWATDDQGKGCPGWFYWEPSPSDTGEGSLEYYVTVYNGSEEVDWVGWTAQGESEPFLVDSFLWEPRESGQYRFSVQLNDWEDESRSSDPVWSDVWTYTNPGVSLSAPYGLSVQGNTLTWRSDSDSDYFALECSYRQDKDGKSRRSSNYGNYPNNSVDLSRITRSFRYGDGYYQIRVRTLSADITKACPSGWSDELTLQVANGQIVSGGGSGGIVSSGSMVAVRDGSALNWALTDAGEVRVSGPVSSSAPVWVAAYDREGRMLSASLLTAPGSVSVAGGDEARVFWLDVATDVPRAKNAEIPLH